MGRRIKNKEIAEKLGLSNTLVSLVLNNKADQQGIRKDTQEKVLNLATKLGYFDDLQRNNESSPVEDRPGVMGMIVTSINDPFIFSISPWLQKAFAQIGVGFSVVTKDPDDLRFNRMITAFRKFYSGLILVGNAADEYTLRTLRSMDFPFIVLEKNIKNLHLNTVTSDITAGAEMVADHIYKLGYKNVLIITGDIEDHLESGVVRDLNVAFGKRTGINVQPVVKLKRSEVDEKQDYSVLEKHFRPPYRTDVIVIINADHVYKIMAFLQNNRVRVPQDLALISMEEGVGFDLTYSPVTCLRKPVETMAAKAANMLWSEVKNSGKGKYKRQISLDPELIIRNSC